MAYLFRCHVRGGSSALCSLLRGSNSDQAKVSDLHLFPFAEHDVFRLWQGETKQHQYQDWSHLTQGSMASTLPSDPCGLSQ